MSNELQGAIDVLVRRIEQKAQELAENKRTVNSLCREAGREPVYPDAELAGTTYSGMPAIRSSEFYGKTPTVAAREYLDKRGDAVPLDEILDAMVRGGFDFDNQGWPEDQRLRHLGSSMGKNSTIFRRLPNDTWGLTKWYPNIKPRKAKANGKTQDSPAESAESATASVDTEEENEKTKTANAE